MPRKPTEQPSPDSLVICVRPDGDLECLYSDELGLDDLGDMEVRRASNVEFDSDTGEWVAQTPDGVFIARDRSRKACIQAEIRYFNARFLEGFHPFSP